MDEEMKREIIIEHFTNPIHKESKGSDFFKSNTNNESCIDNIDIYVKVNNGILEDIYFDGEACAITTSSTSIMIKNLIGKSISDALKYINNFENMVHEQPYDQELLNEAIVYEDIYKQQNRVKCSLMPYVGIKKILEKL